MKRFYKHIILGVILLICLIYLLSRCTLFQPSSEKPKEKAKETVTKLNTDKEIDEYIKNMTIEEKVYQMFFVTPEQLTGYDEVIRAGEATKSAVEEKPVGGLIYFAKNILTEEQISEMLEKTQEFSEIPMFFGVDEEGGRVSRLSDNPEIDMEKIESMGSIGAKMDYERAYEVGFVIGKKLSQLGFNVDFAPVADVSSSDADNVIGNRSFGSDPEVVSEMVSNVISGLDKNGISATLKHFPGQGMTTGDTHDGAVKSDKARSEIRKTDLVPFEKGIESGADFVMIGHMTVSSLDKENPATFSKKIVTDLLRKELNFNGIIITDAMNMQAITNKYDSGEAAIKAINAGVDMILMPNDFAGAVKGVLDAVEDGKISESRIDESVKRIIKLKMEKGLLK